MIRGEVGQIVVTQQLIATDKRRVLLPPSYTRYFAWGYIDQSTRIGLVEGEKVMCDYCIHNVLAIAFKMKIKFVIYKLNCIKTV